MEIQVSTKPLNVLVIGASACGAKAVSRVRRLNPSARITMLDQRRRISFAACGLPYYVKGEVPELDHLTKTGYGRVRDAAYFKEIADVDVRLGMRAEAVDRQSRTVRARNVDSGAEESFPYDNLVLAMGASPVKPTIEGIDLKNVVHLTTLEDAEAAAQVLQERPRGSAVIIGAGFIGVEAAEALAARKWDVAVLERCGQVLPKALDFEVAAMVEEHMRENRVEFELGAEILRLEGEGGAVKRVVTKNGARAADLVILATGLRPNVELARAAGLAIGKSGALAVDSRMRTSDPDIFAGGDIVENTLPFSGQKRFAPLGSTANKHGRVIADNICGLDSEFPGIAGTWICKAFDLGAGATGLTETAAREAGIDACSVIVPGFDKAHYYPGGALLLLKLTAERKTDRLLGLQVVGRGDVARRIDVAATALRFGATLEQVAGLDLAYAPPYSQALDCLITAANAAKNAQAGIFKRVSAAETRRMLAEKDNLVVADVRSALEFKRFHLDSTKVVNIPLDQLRARMNELPREKRIVCLCYQGLRSFTAQRILEAEGFGDVRTLEGGLFAWPWKEDLA